MDVNKNNVEIAVPYRAVNAEELLNTNTKTSTTIQSAQLTTGM
jgi:hypothetical protein